MRVVLGILISIGLNSQVWACSTFNFLDLGSSVVGKSYDWGLGHGMVATNKRNVFKRAVSVAASDVPMQWTSQHASITFTQFGVEFPLGGMNEKGLNVEIMWLTSSVYPTAAEDQRPIVNELQWIQYILDTSATIGEATANAMKVRVSPLLAKVHYLVCDRTAQCATFEYLNKMLTVNQGTQMALTNNTYQKSMTYLADFQGFGGTQALPVGETHSLDRFVLAMAGIRDFRNQSAASVYAMDLLGSVRQDTSRWNIVYEQSAQTIYFRTDAEPNIKSFKPNQFNPSCKAPIMVVDMNSGFKAGDITSQFQIYDDQFNRDMIERNTFLTQNLIDIAEQYPATTRCLE